jgi:predicted RecB family nuclease
MQVLDDHLVLSASDLNDYLACGHLTTLDLARARGEIDAAPERGAGAMLLAEKGDEHEERYLESLKAAGKEVVEITLPEDGSRAALEAAAAQTEEALRAGPDVIYQATFFRDGLRGHADFLFRVDDRSSNLGDAALSGDTAERWRPPSPLRRKVK